MRYKLKVIDKGDYVHMDDGGLAFRADTEDEARAMFLDYGYEPHEVEKMHSFTLLPRIVYARDVEAGDCHEDAEPGDTTYDSTARTDADGAIKVWATGPAPGRWSIVPEDWPQVRAWVEGRDLGLFPDDEAARTAIQDELKAAGLR